MKALVVCGLISSGKSSLVSQLSHAFSWDITSFGNYVRHMAQVQGIAQNRGSLQTLGFDLLQAMGSQRFLEEVIKFNEPRSSVHLYDSVRHTSIIDEIRKIYEKSLVIYLLIEDQERYSRYIKRSAIGDPKLSFKEFCKLSQMPIEQGIVEIEKIADVCLDANLPPDELEQTVQILLMENGFL